MNNLNISNKPVYNYNYRPKTRFLGQNSDAKPKVDRWTHHRKHRSLKDDIACCHNDSSNEVLFKSFMYFIIPSLASMFICLKASKIASKKNMSPKLINILSKIGDYSSIFGAVGGMWSFTYLYCKIREKRL